MVSNSNFDFLWQDGARMEGKGAQGGRCCFGKKFVGPNDLEKMRLV